MSFGNPFNKNPLEAPRPAEKTDGKENYNLESGVTVNLSWNKFSPEKKIVSDSNRVINPLSGAVIYLPGWAMDSDDQTIQQVAKDFAEENETYAITTRTEQAKPKTETGETIDVLYEEAKAISAFIKEHNLRGVTIAGHSQGGDKAINVVSILQKTNPEVSINGLILIDSVGLYEQKELAQNFTKDMLGKTPANLVKPKNWSAIPSGLRVSSDIFGNIFKEMKKSKIEYPGRLRREVAEMSEKNPRMADIKAPIVLISGSRDPLSDPHKIIPFEEEAKIQEEREQRSNQRKELEGSGGQWQGSIPVYSRQKFLQENYFPNSQSIDAVFPDKLGHHGGIFFRDLVKNGMYLLKRRDQKESRDEKTVNENYLSGLGAK